MSSNSEQLIDQIINSARALYHETWEAKSIKILIEYATTNVLYIKLRYRNIDYLTTLDMTDSNSVMHLSEMRVPYHSYQPDY